MVFLARSSSQPTDLECPYRLIARSISGKNIGIRCVGRDCALFVVVKHGLTNSKVLAGCAVKVDVLMDNKMYVWE